MKHQGLTFKDSDLLNLHMIICMVDKQPVLVPVRFHLVLIYHIVSTGLHNYYNNEVLILEFLVSVCIQSINGSVETVEKF